MSRSFTRGKKPVGSRSTEETKDGTPSPARPVPLPIGGHRAPPSSSGTPGPAPISQLRTWTSARPTGRSGRRPGLLGNRRGSSAPQEQQEQQESETEEAKYNNVDDGPGPAPRPTGAYAYVSEEQLESETEEEKYNNLDDNPGPAPRPTGAYAYVSEEQLESETEEEVEEEAEEEKYNNLDDGPVPHAFAYTGIPDQDAEQEQEEESDEAKYNNVEDDAPAPVVQQIQQQAERRAQPEDEQEEEQKDEAPVGKAPQAPKDVPAVRKHRAWLVSKLGDHYKNERTEQRPDLVKAAKDLGTVIAKYYQALAEFARIGSGGDWRAVLGVFPNASPVHQATTFEDAEKFLRQRYEEFLEKARREDLPIQEDGTVGDLSTRMVEYDEDEGAQQRSLVLVGGQKLVRNDGAGTPVDTAQSVTHHTGLGAEIFVVGLDNEIHMKSHKIGKFHHSSLLGGKPVSMAGEMKVTGGKIDWISNKSGHYWPTLPQLQQFLHHLGKDVPLDFEVRSMGPAAFPAGSTAQQVLEGIDADGNEDEKLGHDHVKTQSVIKAWMEMVGKPAVKKVIQDNGWTIEKWDGEYDVEDTDGEPVPNQDVRRAFKAAYPEKRARTVVQQ